MKITLAKGKIDFKEFRQLSQDVNNIDLYFIEWIEKNDIITDTKFAKSIPLKIISEDEIENKFQESKTKFATVCFDHKIRFFTICFENNCFVFKINFNEWSANDVNNMSTTKFTICPKIKRFILDLLSYFQKIKILFSKKGESEIFQKIFGINDKIILPQKYIVNEIDEEVGNFTDGIQNYYKINILKPDLIYIRAIFAYVIRRNYYESYSFKDPSFFEREVDARTNWKKIIDEIKTFNIDGNNLSRNIDSSTKFEETKKKNT